jgi:hypothetical protein
MLAGQQPRNLHEFEIAEKLPLAQRCDAGAMPLEATRLFSWTIDAIGTG